MKTMEGCGEVTKFADLGFQEGFSIEGAFFGISFKTGDMYSTCG